jgi:putative tryptophan/tyrosine transport system permease protein
MNATTVQLLYTLETTLVFSIVTIGVYLSFRVLRFPDLTAEGSFGLAAMVGGAVLVTTGSPVLGLLASIVTGALAGIVTAVLANVVRLPTLLASILTMIMCFSVGLLVVGQPSQTLPDQWVLAPALSWMQSPIGRGIIGAGAVLAILIVAILLFLRTGAGFILRARGENPDLTRELRHSLVVWDIVGLALANGIVGFSAALFSQRSGYASINMGRGMAIYALAAIMLGEAIFPSRTMLLSLLSCVVGTLILQLVRLLALNLGMPDGALDLVTSLLVIVFVYIAKIRGHSEGNVLEKIRMEDGYRYDMPDCQQPEQDVHHSRRPEGLRPVGGEFQNRPRLYTQCRGP